MSIEDNNNNKQKEETDLFLYYVKDIGFQTFEYLCDLLVKTVSEEKPLSPYVASAMISNLIINFVKEYVTYNQQKDEKQTNQLKKDMFDSILKFIWFENNKEIAQEIQDHPERALDLLKQKYLNMQISKLKVKEEEEQETI